MICFYFLEFAFGSLKKIFHFSAEISMYVNYYVYLFLEVLCLRVVSITGLLFFLMGLVFLLLKIPFFKCTLDIIDDKL